jgi:hypothetical protein
MSSTIPGSDRNMLLTDYLFRSANLYPEHEIIVQGKRRISYELMFRRVMEVASFLRSEDIVVAGDRVGVCMENSPEYFSPTGIIEAGVVVDQSSDDIRAINVFSGIAGRPRSLLGILLGLVKAPRDSDVEIDHCRGKGYRGVLRWDN